MPTSMKIEDLWDVCDEIIADFEGTVAETGYKLFFAPDPQYPEKQMKINRMILDDQNRSIVFIAE